MLLNCNCSIKVVQIVVKPLKYLSSYILKNLFSLGDLFSTFDGQNFQKTQIVLCDNGQQ